ncbi:MAG: hypothetical protein AAF223_15380, partial [Bacteroidota bacterium]
MSEAAIDYVADQGYDPTYGARPLKRAIQRELENPIATMILENTFTEGSTLKIGMSKASGLTFKVKAAKAELAIEEVPKSATSEEIAEVDTSSTAHADEAEKETVTIVSD